MIKIRIAVILLVLTTLLSACASNGFGLAQADSTLQSSTLQSKLGAGLLALEGTDQAVTAEQAGVLIPLWQAYKSMSGSDSSSQSEIQALYRQIQEALTSEQLEAIRLNEFSQEALNALMHQYGVKTGRVVSQTGSQAVSEQTSNPAQAPMGEMGAEMPAGGEMNALMGGEMGAVMPAEETASSTQTSAAAHAAADLNSLFAGAVLQVLSARMQS